MNTWHIQVKGLNSLFIDLFSFWFISWGLPYILYKFVCNNNALPPSQITNPRTITWLLGLCGHIRISKCKTHSFLPLSLLFSKLLFIFSYPLIFTTQKHNVPHVSQYNSLKTLKYRPWRHSLKIVDKFAKRNLILYYGN